jgi:hypothetical protein
MACGASCRPYEVASALGSYALISSAMVVLNKIVFTHLGSKVPYPTFVTWFQMLVTLVFCLLADATVARPENKLIRPIAMSTSIARDLVPLSLAYCGTIVLNNLSLRSATKPAPMRDDRQSPHCVHSYVELAFYPVIRSTSIIFTIILNNCMLPQKIPLMVILSCVSSSAVAATCLELLLRPILFCERAHRLCCDYVCRWSSLLASC